MSKVLVSTGLILLLVQFAIASDKGEFRIININDFNGEGVYLPVKSGQKFIIEVEGNPTTGYIWFLDDVEKINKELIFPLNLNEKNSVDPYNYKTDDESEIHKIRGSGGLYHFKFQAHDTNSGSEVLKFIYKRPWTAENEVKKLKYDIMLLEIDKRIINRELGKELSNENKSNSN